ncbi:MAG: acyl-CoA dehydrogenase family protein [Mycobacteriales bacterium]
MRYVQHVPEMPDVYGADRLLRAHLDRVLGDPGHAKAAPLLDALGREITESLRAAATDAEAHPPVLRQYDGWGRRIDTIDTSAGWETHRRAATRHGLAQLPYEDGARAEWGAGARVVQHALLHIYAPESATYSCPVAMTDGAIAVLRAPGVDRSLQDRLLPRLLSRDPETAWTSGQWMTETEGGSDVGRASTRAEWADGAWRLYGEKWFCSSTASELAIALARPAGAPDGSRGLACFVVPRYAGVLDGAIADERVTSADLYVHRLKDKLGTRALPSGEVGLDGVVVAPVGDPAVPGLHRMLVLVQITRLHNAAAAAAGMRHGLLRAVAYAGAREAFGSRLDRQPLHRETLGWLAVDADAAFALTALCFELLGRSEKGDESAGRLLRIAAPLAKARTARLAVAAASEYVESFGGPGYVEDTGIPRLLRDAQVLPIWEGTTNVLSLDVLRALSRDDALSPYVGFVDEAIAASDPVLGEVAATCAAARRRVADAAEVAQRDPGGAGTQARARGLMTDMADLLAAAALLRQATWDAARGDDRLALVVRLWTERRLAGTAIAGAAHENFEQLVGHPSAR